MAKSEKEELLMRKAMVERAIQRARSEDTGAYMKVGAGVLVGTLFGYGVCRLFGCPKPPPQPVHSEQEKSK